MSGRRTLAAALALGFSIALGPVAGDAAAIEEIAAKNLTPAPGSTTTFQIAVSPDDNTVWNAGSYTLTLIAADPSGTTVATSDTFTGDEPAAPQQTTMVFVDLGLPGGYVGPLVVHAHLSHGKTSEDSTPIGIVVGGAGQTAGQTAAVVPAASPPPGQEPAPGAAVPSPNPSAASATPGPPPLTATGTLALNAGFAAQQTQNAVLSLSGKAGLNDSYTLSAGLANTPGVTKPFLTLQMPSLLVQGGTITPSYERDAFAGPTGTGVGFKTSWNNNAEVLQGAYISGNHDTTNPFEMEALEYGFRLWGSNANVTGGYEDIYGDTQPGPYFLRDGAFLGFGDDVTAPHSTFTYGIHYGTTLYHDDIGNDDKFGNVLDLALGFAIRKARFAFTYEYASPAFANASAPAITPDRETENASITFPLGVLQLSFAANAYRDDLPGSTLLQMTHFVTENAGITYPLRNGDVLSFQATNGVQHQTGDPIAPFSGNDGTTFSYTTRRGPFAIQYSLADTETRDNSGDLTHVVTNGLTVSHVPFSGLTLSGGVNVNQNYANVSSQTNLSDSGTFSINYVRGVWTLSTQVNVALSRAEVGLSSPPTTTYNYGVSVKPRHSPYAITASITENTGSMNTSVGALSLNRQF